MNRTLKKITDDIKLAIEYVDRMKIKNNIIISKTQGAKRLAENIIELDRIISKACGKYDLNENNFRKIAGYVK